MSINQVSQIEELPVNKKTFYDFENGSKSLGYKGTVEIGEFKDEVYNNFHFIKNKLRSGSYIFYELSDNKINNLLGQIETKYGEFVLHWGNQKLIRTYTAGGDKDVLKYLREGHSVELIWTGQKDTTITLRIINTKTDIFGTWGWLSFYEDEYFASKVEPEIIRTILSSSKTRE